MGRGPKNASQRAKVAKHLRSSTKKKFRNDNPEARAKYATKMASRIKRKASKKARRK